MRSLVNETLSAWEPMFSALDQTWQAWSRGGGDHREECRECRGRCDCNSCGADADVLVTARPGERRVIPIDVRNPTHRPVAVTLDPGPWTSCDGNQVAVRSVVRPDDEVLVAGCSSREFLLLVEIGGLGDDAAKPGDLRDDYRQDVPLRCCTTLTSDVRVNGCGTTLRVAINVLPVDCDPVPVTCCGCGC